MQSIFAIIIYSLSSINTPSTCTCYILLEKLFYTSLPSLNVHQWIPTDLRELISSWICTAWVGLQCTGFLNHLLQDEKWKDKDKQHEKINYLICEDKGTPVDANWFSSIDILVDLDSFGWINVLASHYKSRKCHKKER